MSSSTTSTKSTAMRRGSDTGTMQQSTIYKGIMTPIIFVSFLVSLVWVDIRYTIKRSRNHSHGGWMPSWLHSIVYRRSPYHYVQVKQQTTPGTSSEHGEWYYHSKQKKLLRMEVDDAFQMRGQVLATLALVAVVAVCGVVLLSSWVFRSARHGM